MRPTTPRPGRSSAPAGRVGCAGTNRARAPRRSRRPGARSRPLWNRPCTPRPYGLETSRLSERGEAGRVAAQPVGTGDERDREREAGEAGQRHDLHRPGRRECAERQDAHDADGPGEPRPVHEVLLVAEEEPREPAVEPAVEEQVREAEVRPHELEHDVLAGDGPPAPRRQCDDDRDRHRHRNHHREHHREAAADRSRAPPAGRRPAPEADRPTTGECGARVEAACGPGCLRPLVRTPASSRPPG